MLTPDTTLHSNQSPCASSGFALDHCRAVNEVEAWIAPHRTTPIPTDVQPMLSSELKSNVQLVRGG